jgi:hypothetical protein
MREARPILELLRERGRKGLPVERVYRLLHHPDLFLLAYGRIYRNQGAMTKGATGETADGMHLDKITAIIRHSSTNGTDGVQPDVSPFPRLS